jgi:hypothetical protein
LNGTIANFVAPRTLSAKLTFTNTSSFFAPFNSHFASYSLRFVSSDSVSYALAMALNASAAAARSSSEDNRATLSGWYLSANFLYAFLISSLDASGRTPKVSYAFDDPGFITAFSPGVDIVVRPRVRARARASRFDARTTTIIITSSKRPTMTT